MIIYIFSVYFFTIFFSFVIVKIFAVAGFTPLILAATAGHADVVENLLLHGADIEAQSERTKDTPLSLACSGGRYEVVELLLARGANKEHRNVSDYTPLSLAASGGYVNIIKLLLSHGAEINSRSAYFFLYSNITYFCKNYVFSRPLTGNKCCKENHKFNFHLSYIK